MMKDDIIHELDYTMKQLLQAFSDFSQDEIDISPASDSWSAGQVAEHLLKASVADILYGPIKPTQRAPDQHVPELKAQFLDFTVKLKSPAFILPTERVHNKEVLLEKLAVIGDRVREAVLTLDLSVTCLMAPKELGDATRLELIWFFIVHTQRHTHQLKQIQLPRAHSLT